MKRSYPLLLAAILTAATLVALAARPRENAPALPTASVPGPRAEAAISLALGAGRVAPASTSAPKGALVRLSVENRDAEPHRVALLGYEGRFAPVTIGPGRTAVVRFPADRPGSDFAWMVDGRPAGRFAVTGSHLVEGHR